MRRVLAIGIPVVLATIFLFSSTGAAAAIWSVDSSQPDDSQCVNPTYLCKTIGAAVTGSTGGDTINVLAGTYNENLVVNKSLTLNGAQAGVDACDRAAAESIVTGAGTLVDLKGGSAGTIIDGFTFDGGTNQVSSSSGPIDSLELRNNRHVNFTGVGVFLNDSGTDITADQIYMDGSSSPGGGAIFHLDTDNFDGFQLTNSCFFNHANGFAFFVDGNRNVGVSGARPPLFDGNLFDGHQQAMNIGKRGLEGATISNNVFRNSSYDGLIGGPKDTSITGNIFADNGRRGLRLTAFSDADPAKGPINTTVTDNCFTGNGFVQTDGAAIELGPDSPNMDTNSINNNNIEGNVLGVISTNADTVDATNNWWGAADGPAGPDGTGSGDGVDGVSGGGAVTFSPYLAAKEPNAPDCVPPPLPAVTITGLVFIGLGLLTALGYGIIRQRG